MYNNGITETTHFCEKGVVRMIKKVEIRMLTVI